MAKDVCPHCGGKLEKYEKKIVYGRYARQGGQWIWQDDGTLNMLNNIIENLRGHIRRLEKSNQELGLALRKCQAPDSKGWD